MKKFLFIATAALTMVSCSKDSEVIPSIENGTQNAIGFQVTKQNMGRALMQSTHYNFGVFAYKSTDATNNIMADYLVGYFDNVNKVGYNPNGKQTTHGDQGNTQNGKSFWSYEALGNTEYTWSTNGVGETYYTTTDNAGYMSNWENQFLRFFDESAASTTFYAYAPYINKTAMGLSGQVAFNNTSKEMTFPAGSIVAGYDDPTKYEYLFSMEEVAKGQYKEDVTLGFKHLNSKVRIVFYEDIAGYDVRMIDLDDDAEIIAVPALQSGDIYTYATEKVAKTASVKVDFTKYTGTLDNFTNGPVKLPEGDSWLAATATNAAPWDAIDGDINDKALTFKRPTVTLVEDRATAVGDYQYYSNTVYYGIPNAGNFGLTFRVSFELKSTTGEIINVYNSGVFVPATACEWKPGKQYTYVFRITKNANGTTDDGKKTGTVDPDPGKKALYPIVFDGLTIEDWATAVETEHPIN